MVEGYTTDAQKWERGTRAWRGLWRDYVLAALLMTAVPLAVLFFTIASTTRENTRMLRAVEDRNLLRMAHAEAILIDHQLGRISQITELFRRHAALAYRTRFEPEPAEKERYAYAADGSYYTVRDTGGAALYYSGYHPVGERERQKALLMSQLDPLMKQLTESHPLVRKIYINTWDSMSRIYPYIDVLEAFGRKRDLPAAGNYYEADRTHNPERRTVWTTAPSGSEGTQWTMSSIAPVYLGDSLEAVVGIDVDAESVAHRAMTLDVPWSGYSLLVDGEGAVLAHRDAAKADLEVKETDRWSRLTSALAAAPSGLDTVTLSEPRRVVWATVPTTGWRLAVVVPEANLRAHTAERSENPFSLRSGLVLGVICFSLGLGVLFSSRRRASRFGAPPRVRLARRPKGAALAPAKRPLRERLRLEGRHPQWRQELEPRGAVADRRAKA